MANTITIPDFPVATTLEDADVFWATRGTGKDRDKTVTALLLQKYIGDVCLKIISTGSVNLDTYFTNVVILSDPSAGITVTISGSLPEGKKLFIINLSAFLVNIAIESITVGLIENEYTEWMSDGADMNKLWNIFNNFTKVKYLTNADSPYTITDGETYQKYIGDTAGGNIIINLPTLADNYEKEYEFFHAAQGGSNIMTIQREGSDEITQDLLTEIQLPKFQNLLKLLACSSSAKWEITHEKLDCQTTFNIYNGYGSVDTCIIRFNTQVESFGNLFTHNHPGYNGNTEGLTFIINKSGIYTFTHTGARTSTLYLGISKDSTQNNLSIHDDTFVSANRLCEDTADSGVEAGVEIAGSCSWSGYLIKGSAIRAHTNGVAIDKPNHCSFIASYSR